MTSSTRSPDARLARADDPHTSKLAATAAGDGGEQSLVSRQRRAILNALAAYGRAGKDGIARHCGLDGVAVARRLKAMEDDGLVRRTSELTHSNAGRQERVWDLTERVSDEDHLAAVASDSNAIARACSELERATAFAQTGLRCGLLSAGSYDEFLAHLQRARAALPATASFASA